MAGKGEKIILGILNTLANKNPKQYAKLTDSQKLDHVKKELAKLGLYIDKNSAEMQSFENLKKLNVELNNYLQELINSIIYSNNQTKLLRLANNINSIIDNYTKINQLLDSYKQTLKPFTTILTKNVKKIPRSKTRSRNNAVIKSRTRSTPK